MSSLNAFLHPVQVENQEVVVSKRFLEDGNPVPFLIRPISQEENEAMMKRYTKKKKSGEMEFDNVTYTAALVASAVVFPDLKNAELQKAYGVLGEEKLLKKMLFVGEYANLTQAVQKLSGLDADVNDLIDEVKNA